jgi:hypothetical protein
MINTKLRYFLISISISIALCRAQPVLQATYIDPSEINDTLLAPIVNAETRQQLEKRFEKIVLSKKWNNTLLKQFAPVLFSYRDYKLKYIFRNIISDNQVHEYFKIRSIHSLGEIGDTNDYKFLLSFSRSPNPVIREYIANAIGKLNGIQNPMKKVLINE